MYLIYSSGSLICLMVADCKYFVVL